MDKLDLILQKIDSMDVKMESMQSDIEVMKGDIAETKESILKINLRLDEDIYRSIRIIADGHIDLERKYGQILLDKESKVYLHTKILCHDAEINQIKLRCTKCA